MGRSHLSLHLTHSILGSQSRLLERDFLGGLGLLSEDGLRLATVASLLHVVPPSALSESAFLGLLVLRDLAGLVILALLAVSLSSLGYLHHFLNKF